LTGYSTKPLFFPTPYLKRPVLNGWAFFVHVHIRMRKKMSFDIHMLPGSKRYVNPGSREALLVLVRESHPKAMCEGGGGGSYTFHEDGVLVAEVWMHPTKPGW
jgi:hypothetical protein